MPEKRLNDRQVLNAKGTGKPYRLYDGGGLMLNVTRRGVRSWQFSYSHAGKKQTFTIGRYPDVGLAEARALAVEARKTAAKGVHLTVAKRIGKAKRAAHAAASFGRAAADWVARESKRARWTDDYRQEVEASLRNHLSALDALPVAEITAAIAAPVLHRAEARAPNMAKKVRFRLRAILDQASEDGLIRINPIPAARRRKAPEDRKHLPAVLDHEAIGEILRAADVADVCRGVRRAHLLSAFTAQRIGEIVGATWDEIDLAAATWAIPRARMKRKDAERGPHVVPLPPRLLAEMREWRRADGEGAGWVCPAPHGGGPITREATEKFYRRGLGLARRHTLHGWRSVFSTWAGDAGKDRDAIEAHLDHATGGKVQTAYDRGTRLELRRALLAWHEAALIAARDGARVLPLKRGA